MTSDEQHATSGLGAGPTNGTTDPMTSHPANHAANGATDPDRLDLLDRYWDATTGNGFQRAAAIVLDPAHARTVDLIQTLTNDATAGIPADARARIWRETVATAAIPTRQESPVTASALPGSGAATPNATLPASKPPRGRRATPPGGPIPPTGRWSVPGGGGPSQPTGRTWWPRLQFAVAAALILGLFATILAPMDDGRVGLFGGIGDDATPTVSSPSERDYFPVDIALPASDQGHAITFDRVTIPAEGTFDLAADLFHTVEAESGSVTVLTLGAPGNGGLTIDAEQSQPVPVDLGGGRVTAGDESATIRLTTIAPIESPAPALADGVTVEPLASYTTSSFAGQRQVDGLLTSVTTTTLFDQLIPFEIEGTDSFRSGSAEAFAYAESGTTQISSGGRQARRIPAGSGQPGDFATSIDLTAGDSAIVGDASLAAVRSVHGYQDGTITALILAPTVPSTPQVISNSSTPYVDPGLGRTGQVTVEIPPPYTTAGIVALERVTIEPGVSWVVPDGSPMTALWVAGSATQVQDGTILRPETDPLDYSDVVTLDPGMTIGALSPNRVIFDRAVFYPSITPPAPTPTAGVTIAPLGQAPITNIANATAVDLHLREGATGTDPQDPFIVPAGVATDQVNGVFAVQSGTLQATTTDSRIQPSSTGGAANTARVVAGESVFAYGLDGITVTTASGETMPATYLSAYATVRFAGSMATPAATPDAGSAELTTLADTTIDATATDPFQVSIEQHVMGPDADYLFRFGDAPGGRIVTWVEDGSATLSMDGQAPVEISAGSPENAVADLAVTGDLRIVPGPEGATLYHLQIGIPIPLNGTGGSVGHGTLAVSYLGSWADMGNDDPMVFPAGIDANANVTLTLGTTTSEAMSFDAGTGAVLVLPTNGPARVTADAGPVRLGGLMTGDPIETGQPTDIVPGQNITGSPGGTFTVAASGSPADYLELRITLADPGTAATPAASVTSPLTDLASYSGGGAVLDIPASEDGHLVSIERLRVPAGARQDLPAGSSYLLQPIRGTFTLERTGGGQPQAVTDASVVNVGLDGGAIVAGNDEIVVTILSISPLQDRPFGLLAVGGSAPLTLYETTDLIGMTQANVSLGRGPVPTEPAAIPPFGTDNAPAELSDPGTILLFVTESNATTITSTGPLLENVGQGTTPSEPVASLTVENANTVVVRNPAAATFQQARPDESALYTSVAIASVPAGAISAATPAEETPAATPVSADSTTIVPSVGYPEAFTGGGLLVDLPVSASGHRVSVDRVTIADGSTLTLPPGAAYQAASVSGQFTVERRSGSSPLTVDQPSIIDVNTGGGAILADQRTDITVTVLTIAPDGATPLASSDGITVYPLTSYTTGSLRFDSQLNVLFGNGSAPVNPEPVGPSANTDDPMNLADSGATMLLYAEQGSIRIIASADVIRDREFSPETPVFVSDLTIAAGETAIVTNPSLATIQQATPGEGAVYTAVFLAPPGLDRMVGRTYPNATGGGTGIQPVPADGDDYQIVLDRLTLEPGATATFPAGTFRAMQWTGGGLATMVSDEAARPPVVFDERSLNASFEDQGFRLAATGDTPVTLTLMSYLPAGSSEETVPTGQAGMTSERLTTYTDTNVFNSDHLQFTFFAAGAEGFAVDIAPGLGLNLTGGNAVDAYALIRPEGGPIVLNRPARRIVDGTETTQIAAGEAVIPGETVRVDDLRDATLQGPTDGTRAGYTLVVVSPYDDPNGAGSTVDTTPQLTGLTATNLDAVVSVPADQPLTMELIQQTLVAGATLTISPVYGSATEAVPPITVLSYVATGDGTIGLAGDAGTELSDRSSETAMRSVTSAGPITIRAGTDGATIYQLVIASARPEYDVTGDSTSTSVVLGTYSGADLIDGSGAAGETVDLEITLRSSVGGFGDGSSGTLGRDSAITLLTPLVGSARITPGTGEVRIIDATSGDRSGATTTMPTTLAPGGSLIALPGGVFRVAAETESDTLSYLSAEIRVSTLAAAGTPVAAPVVGTPAPSTPAATGSATCDIKPRTVEELLTLYDEGIASPVDPLALSHRDDLGTGTPADNATIAAVTDTLLRQSACQNLDDPLRQYALYSDQSLRYVLPVVYQSREELGSLLEQPPSEVSAADAASITISDVEVFADGRVGARVALDGEFAYVTFAQATDGTWLMEVFDDRYEPGA